MTEATLPYTPLPYQVPWIENLATALTFEKGRDIGLFSSASAIESAREAALHCWRGREARPGTEAQ